MTHKPDAVEREMDFEPKRAWGEDLICSRCNEIIFENGAYVKAQDKIFCHVCVLDQAKINQKQLATTTAELKELREFIGAMEWVAIEDGVGIWNNGRIAQHVLIQMKNKAIHTGYVLENAIHLDGFVSSHPKSEATHWMPLPEPYTEAK